MKRIGGNMKCEIILDGGAWSMGILTRTVENMKIEHAGYYGKPCGWGRGYGYQPDNLFHRWITSGGNVFGIREDPLNRIHIMAEGRRHGIPWRFLPKEAREQMERTFFCDGIFNPKPRNYGEVKWIETREPKLAPWHTNNSDYLSEWYDDPDRYWGE
jgi:hypothetical protein